MTQRLDNPEFDKIKSDAEKVHRIWHKFSRWLTNTYGKDLYGHWVSDKIKTAEGKTVALKYRSFNELELSRRLVGYDVMRKVERYAKRCCPEIRILRCDDEVYSSSTLLLIPHPQHGITIMFIPQCTSVQNQFFYIVGTTKV
jgi:hypothetical protein